MESTNDLVTKNFEAYPDVAADILNVLLYEGKNEIYAVSQSWLYWRHLQRAV